MDRLEWRKALQEQQPIHECSIPRNVQCEIWRRTRDIGIFFKEIKRYLRNRGFVFPSPTGDGKPAKILHYSFLDKDKNMVNRIIRRPKVGVAVFDEVA